MKGMRIIKKTTVTTLAFVMLVGAGTIYANLDPEKQFSRWYNQSLEEKTDQIATYSSKELSRSLEAFDRFLQETAEEGNVSIQQVKVEQTNEATESIESHKEQYLEQLDDSVVDFKEKGYEEHVNKAKETQAEKTEEEVEALLSEVLNN